MKTDAVDAATPAQLLRAGLLPGAYIAPRQLRDVRELLRHRVTLVAIRSAIKNRVHAILAKHGVIHQHADVFGKAGRQFGQILTLCYYSACATARSAASNRPAPASPMKA